MTRQYTPEDLEAIAKAARLGIGALVERVDQFEPSDNYSALGSQVVRLRMQIPGHEIEFSLVDQGDAWYAIELDD